MRLIFILTVSLFLATFFMNIAHAGQPAYGKWYTTHTIEKFPCMNEKEIAFLKRITSIEKIEQKNLLLASHRKEVKPSARRPASIHPDKLTNKNFICPPFKGVKNPYPQAVEFGKAATFERIKLLPSHMQIINGLSKNQQWPLNYNPEKGYYEGQTSHGTPTNLIPVLSGNDVRFMVQYILWQDKTPPSLTLCYREELHTQCNPYPNPDTVKAKATPANQRIPASAAKKPVSPAKS